MCICLVCGYDGLDEPPYIDNDVRAGSFEICSCCGYQFGVDDLDKGITHEAYRIQWLKDGAPWFSNLNKRTDIKYLKNQLLRIGIKLE
jgi:hypothetical protein